MLQILTCEDKTHTHTILRTIKYAVLSPLAKKQKCDTLGKTPRPQILKMIYQ